MSDACKWCALRGAACGFVGCVNVAGPPPYPDMARVTMCIARQARTIRRLFTAYFLAKAKATRNGYEADRNCGACMLQGETLERARIVAALRLRAECIRRIVKAMRAVPHPDYRQIEYDQARADGFMSAADTIERGEL